VWSAEKRAEGLEYMHPKPSSQTINPTNILIAGDTKTEASQKPLPTDPWLSRSLEELWKRSLHKSPQDWVFSNRAGRPRSQQNILRRHLRSAALRAGIGKIGWHTFRHSYSTMLRSAGTDIKVQQELLRHATIQSTMNIYTQAVSEQKRIANSVVVGVLFNSMKLALRRSLPPMGAKERKGNKRMNLEPHAILSK